ncbi:hypothetical protein GC175_28355 [bacterium]|nr:hypothetical protein [bacterium]
MDSSNNHNLIPPVNYSGHPNNTSIEIEVRVEAENLLTGERFHTNSAYFIYVALNEQGQPTEVPRLELTSDSERRRFDEGRARQAHRLKQAGR